MSTVRQFAFVAGLTIAVAGIAAAQPTSASTPDPRWAPWMGCWQVSEESVQDAARLLAELTEGSQPTRAATPGARVCVTPAAEGGVTVTTMANGNAIQVETIVADGRERPISETDCRGTQRAEWSELGARLFARAEITCSNQPTRIVSGLAAMVAGPMWLDIQVIESQGQKSVRVRRYHRAAEPAAPLASVRSIATMPLGGKLSIADIKEASTKVPTEALQAAVLDLGEGGYDLKAKQLIELDDAGVPDTVIDLMIGMSFPKRFTVERASSGGGGFAGYWNELDIWPYMAMVPYVGFWPGYGFPYYGSPFYSPLYSAYYSSFYSPFGYRYWGYFDHGYYNQGGYGFVVVDGGGGGTVTPPSTTGEGRVVNGQGYTRVRRNEPEPAIRVNNGNGGGWGTASTGNGGSSSGSGSSGVSSGGYSSGGSSGGDRTAVPRPPGF
jgi:hypothetical protein